MKLPFVSRVRYEDVLRRLDKAEQQVADLMDANKKALEALAETKKAQAEEQHTPEEDSAPTRPARVFGSTIARKASRYAKEHPGEIAPVIKKK